MRQQIVDLARRQRELRHDVMAGDDALGEAFLEILKLVFPGDDPERRDIRERAGARSADGVATAAVLRSEALAGAGVTGRRAFHRADETEPVRPA